MQVCTTKEVNAQPVSRVQVSKSTGVNDHTTNQRSESVEAGTSGAERGSQCAAAGRIAWDIKSSNSTTTATLVSRGAAAPNFASANGTREVVVYRVGAKLG